MERFLAKKPAVAIATAVASLSLATCGSSDEVAKTAVDRAALKASLAQYRSSLERDTAELTFKIKTLVYPVRSGKLLRAQSFFAIARVPYGQVEPFSESTGKLDVAINATDPSKFPPGKFGGFHRIEKGLWEESTTDNLAPAAEELLANVMKLQTRVKTAKLQPAAVIQSAGNVLDEVVSRKVVGDEARYSEADLVDVAAGVEGAEAAFKAVQPLVAAHDIKWADQISASFRDAYAVLGKYGTLARDPKQWEPNAAGAGFTIHSVEATDTIREIAAGIEPVARQIEAAASLIAGERNF